jgi:hypothetical protein
MTTAGAKAGPSTPLLAKCASSFAQDDTFCGVIYQNEQRHERMRMIIKNLRKTVYIDTA